MDFLVANWILILVALVSGALLAWPWVRNRAGGAALSTLDATRLINGRHAQIVDVRVPDEFARGSLPNAKNIPTAQVKTRVGELKKDRPVLVISDRGNGAGPAAAALRAEGFGDVFILAGGLAAWRDAGLPIRS